jgi:hypothetical protein
LAVILKYPLTTHQKSGIGDFRPVQNLWAVNSATATLHPVVPNPYTLSGLVPAEAKFFTCLDLRDTFSCICLAPQSQPIFAFQWENPNTGEKGQFTWTWLPPGSKTRPLSSELPWHLTSVLSQLTSMATHSSNTWMLDQPGRIVWKGLTSFSLFYGR